MPSQYPPTVVRLDIAAAGVGVERGRTHAISRLYPDDPEASSAPRHVERPPLRTLHNPPPGAPPDDDGDAFVSRC